MNLNDKLEGKVLYFDHTVCVNCKARIPVKKAKVLREPDGGIFHFCDVHCESAWADKLVDAVS